MKSTSADAAVYEAYSFIVPPKYEGGYVLIALYRKIEQKELPDVFSTSDIRQIVADIHRVHDAHPQQAEPIIRKLSQFIIRDEPGKPGKFRLTGHAKRLVRLLIDKIEKPYKNFPLQQTFEEHFTISTGEIKSLVALRVKFDAGIVAAHKQVIYEHLDSLQEELDEAHSNLEKILGDSHLNPTAMVGQFAEHFQAFGSRADDISRSIASKDRFLKILDGVVNEFYHCLEMAGSPSDPEEQVLVQKLKNDWEIALKIQEDLEGFFAEIEEIIRRTRTQIVFANDRLSELHENLAKKSQFQINLKRLLQTALQDADVVHGEVHFTRFPQKELPFEKSHLLYPPFYSFELPDRNLITIIPPDVAYLAAQKEIVESDSNRHRIINGWVKIGKRYLEIYGRLELHQLLNKLSLRGADLQTTVDVAYELTRFAAADARYQVWKAAPIVKLNEQDLYLWTTNIARNPAPIAS